MKMRKNRGKVYLVGAGPGEPGLLTVRGKEILKIADVVIYDALVSPKILKWAKAGCLKICARKKRAKRVLTNRELRKLEQDFIYWTMREHALKSKVIVRLKGGDPFLFGRGGEECEFLAGAGIPFEVVPGVSSVTAVPAYAGIPVTDRRHASTLTVITGHSDEGSEIDWKKISRSGTLVVLMGAANLGRIARKLKENLWPGSTPMAVISSGTLPDQRVTSGTLASLPEKLKRLRTPLKHPAIIVIGNVVRLRRKIDWFKV